MWFRSMMLVACTDKTTKSHEIRVFSRETKLDDAHMIHREPFSHEILAINITESHFLVYTADCVIRYYSILVKDGPKLVFRLCQALSLQDFVGPDSEGVKCIARFPPCSAPTVKNMMISPILFLKNGQLFKISKTSVCPSLH